MNNSDVKVSVIVPVYNTERFLEDRIRTIEEQTLQDIEIIFVDDGSTDGSAGILEQYRSKYPDKVSIIRQKNQYAGVARNNGLKSAKGEYVVFWDADDMSYPTQLEKLYSIITEHDADISICNIMFYDHTNDDYRVAKAVINKRLLPGDKNLFSHDELIPVIFNAFSYHSPNKMFRREFLLNNEISYSAGRIAEDTIFNMKALFLAEKIAVINEPMYIYRVNVDGKNLTSSISGNILANVSAYLEFKDYLMDVGEYDEQVRKSFANKALSGCLRHLDKTDTMDSYAQMYNYLKNEDGLEQLDLTSDDAAYYYKNGDYRRLMKLKESKDLNEFLFSEIKGSQQRLKDKDGKLRKAKQERRRYKEELQNIKKSRAYKFSNRLSSIFRLQK